MTDKRGRKKVIIGCAIAGAAAAVIVFSLAFWENRSNVSTVRQVHEPIEILALVLCPPSIGMMAVDNAPLAMQLVSAFLIMLENAALYGLIGAGLHSIGRRSVGDGDSP
jgi:hypothetical protein